MEKQTADKTSLLLEDKISLKYVPVSMTLLWGDNAKKHDIPQLIQSMQEYGFKDPPAFDETLQALVEGNGRAEALNKMKEDGLTPPRGIVVDQNTGDWLMPILFGVDAENENQAKRYALDHNNLVLSGSGFDFHQIANLWEKDKYIQVLKSLGEDLPLSFSAEDLKFLEIEDMDFGSIDDFTDLADEETPYKEHIIKVRVKDTFTTEASEAILELLENNPDWQGSIE